MFAPFPATDLDEILTAQHDVLHVDQALEFFEPQTVRRHLSARRWQSPHRSVVVMHNGPLTWTQRAWAASLAGPAGSALWGGSAARLDGFRDRLADDRVHLVVPPGARRLTIPGVQTHWSGELGRADVHPVAVPRRTRPQRSLLDLASDASEARRAQAVIFAGVQQRLVTVAALGDALDRRGPCRHHALILETLTDVGGGIHSVPEGDFDAIRRRRGLPPPTRQAVLMRPTGRYYLDALWDEFRLSAEVDGSHHREVQQWEDDLDRTAVVVAGGLRQIRFTSYSVRHRADRVGDLLVQALRSGGWTG